MKERRNLGRAIAAGVVIAELALLDYAAIQLVRNGVVIEVTAEELDAARAAAMEDMSDE